MHAHHPMESTDWSTPLEGWDALDLDQNRRIRKGLDHAWGAGGIRWRPKSAGIQCIHRGDIGRARQQHVDLDEIAEARARFAQNACDVADDKTELSLETVRKGALFVEAGDARDEQQVADPRRE